MISFIKNNKMITGAVAVLFFLVVVIVVIFAGASKKNDTPEPSQDQPFGDIGGIREFASSSQEILSSNPGEKWTMEGESGKAAPLLRAITKVPVVGAVPIKRFVEGKTVEYVRFTTLSNGHIFETPLATISNEEKLASDTLIRIGQSLWERGGNSTITRYLDGEGIVVRSRLGRFIFGTSTKNTSSSTTSPTPVDYEARDLVGNITSIAFSPDGTQLFYLVKTITGVDGYIESIKTGRSTKIWSSMLSSLEVSWDANDFILVYTRPTSVAEGVVWAIDPDTGKENVLLAKEFALGAKMSPDGKKVLYSMQETGNKLFTLKVLNIASKNTISLPLATMIEKCVWGYTKYVYCAVPANKNAGKFLEDWYMGVSSTEDVLWRIDTEVGVIKKLVDPFEETQQNFDIVDIKVSPQETYLVFRTRGNSVLWGLKLPEKTSTETE